MADENVDEIKPLYEALSKGASLDLLIPSVKDLDISGLSIGDDHDPLSNISVRHSLFFDESVNVLVSLKTATPRDRIEQLLSNLELRVAAHATEAVPPKDGSTASTSGKYDLVFTNFRANQNVTVLTNGNINLVVWKATLHIARPKVRLQRAAIYFTAAITVNPEASASRHRQREYLKAFEPLPSNVLEPLQWDPGLLQSGVYLPETRVIKVAPRTSLTKETAKPIRGTSKRAIPVISAVFSRIRYSLIPDAVIASLHVESSKLVSQPISIEDVGFDVATSPAQKLMGTQSPVVLQPGDELVALYRLPIANASPDKSKTLEDDTSPVSITINASMPVEDGSDAEIRVSWQTQVDLFSAQVRPTYRWSRTLSVGSYRSMRASGPILLRPASIDATAGKDDNASATIFTFSGHRIVHQDQTFKLLVHCNNRGHRSRRFALTMLSHRRQRSTRISHVSNPGNGLYDEIFSKRFPIEPPPPDILDLNADVRVGPFSAGACFQTAIRFRATSSGLLDLGTLRIVDLESRQMVDMKDLPDLIALAEATGSR